MPFIRVCLCMELHQPCHVRNTKLEFKDYQNLSFSKLRHWPLPNSEGKRWPNELEVRLVYVAWPDWNVASTAIPSRAKWVSIYGKLFWVAEAHF